MTNQVLILTRANLLKGKNDTPIEDITIEHFSTAHRDMVKLTKLTIFIDDDFIRTQKVLSDRTGNFS